MKHLLDFFLFCATYCVLNMLPVTTFDFDFWQMIIVSSIATAGFYSIARAYKYFEK